MYVRVCTQLTTWMWRGRVCGTHIRKGVGRIKTLVLPNPIRLNCGAKTGTILLLQLFWTDRPFTYYIRPNGNVISTPPSPH